MSKKGFNWADRVQMRPLQPSDAWLSFCYQVVSGMAWGLVTTVVPPKALDGMLHKVFYKALPHCGFQRNIKLEYWTLPAQF